MTNVIFPVKYKGNKGCIFGNVKTTQENFIYVKSGFKKDAVTTVLREGDESPTSNMFPYFIIVQIVNVLVVLDHGLIF